MIKTFPRAGLVLVVVVLLISVFSTGMDEICLDNMGAIIEFFLRKPQELRLRTGLQLVDQPRPEPKSPRKKYNRTLRS